MTISASDAPAFVGVDWGTTRFRAWLLGETGEVLAESRSAEGMRDLSRDAFPLVLARHLDALGAEPRLPVLMCGMVGARQGWREAPYLDVPADAERLAAAALLIDEPGLARQVFCLPGVAVRDADAPDVMRGEETQLLGLLAAAPGEEARLVCMPGTHSKWVRMAAGAITGFRTAMTGELFDVLRRHSILRHSVAEAEAPLDAEAFGAGVDQALAAPNAVPGALFSVRARDLLFGGSPEAAASRLSGLLIGAEIAGQRGPPGETIDLVATGRLADLYGRALAIAGRTVRLQDAESLSRLGLVSAARHLLARD